MSISAHQASELMLLTSTVFEYVAMWAIPTVKEITDRKPLKKRLAATSAISPAR